MSPDDGLPPLTAPQSFPTGLSSLLLNPTLSYIASATLTPANVNASSTSTPSSRPGAENGECKLLGPFALFVQGALGLIALLSLVYKRWRERPQRPVKIWAFDASKQVVGSALLHVANLLMSMVSSGELKVKAEEYQANPCSFYLLNLAIDVSSGDSSSGCCPNMVGYDRLRSVYPSLSSSCDSLRTPSPLLLSQNHQSLYNLGITAGRPRSRGGSNSVSFTSWAC